MDLEILTMRLIDMELTLYSSGCLRSCESLPNPLSIRNHLFKVFLSLLQGMDSTKYGLPTTWGAENVKQSNSKISHVITWIESH